MEASLGTNLFIRNTRNVELTRAGQALLEPARRLTEVAAEARAATQMMRRSMIGSVRVEALPFSFPDVQRTSVIDEFMSLHPEIEIIVRNGPSCLLLEEVKAGRLDLAFVSAPFDETGFDVLTLRESGYCLFLPEDHPVAAFPSIGPEQLKGLRAVMPPPHFNPWTYEYYFKPLVDAGVIPIAVPEFQSSPSYARQLGRLPVICTQYTADQIAEKGMTTRPIEGIPPCRKLLVRLSSHRTPSQVLLWDQVAASLSAAGKAA